MDKPAEWAIEFATDYIFNKPIDNKDLDIMADYGFDASSSAEVYDALLYLHEKEKGL